MLVIPPLAPDCDEPRGLNPLARGIGIDRLFVPELMVEIEVIAVLDDPQRAPAAVAPR